MTKKTNDHWPTFRSDHLNSVCQAFRSKSKSIRYSGNLVCDGGIAVENRFFPTSDSLKFGGKSYYPGASVAKPDDIIEGMHLVLEPRGLPPAPYIDLVVWEDCMHLELARTTKKRCSQGLLLLEGLKSCCDPQELVEVFKWTIGEVALLSEECESDRDREILERIRSRWEALKE